MLKRVAPWVGLAVLFHVPLAPLVDVSLVAQFFRPQSSANVAASVVEIPIGLADTAAIPPNVDERSSPEPNAPLDSDSDSDSEAEASDADAVPAPAPVKKRRRARQRRPPPAPAVPTAQRASAPAPSPASESVADPAAAIAGLNLPSVSGSLRLLLHVERLRGHTLAEPVAALLRGVGQWHGLFQDGALEPTRDIERLLLLTSGVRDSNSAVSIFDYNVQRFQVRQVAVSGQDRVCQFPSPSTLVIGPPSERASFESIPRSFRLPAASAGELLVLHVDKPAQASVRLPWAIPSSVRWLRLQVTLTHEGGARVAFLARDANAAAATRSAQSLTETLGATVVAQADRLRATLDITPEALRSLLEASLAALASSRPLAGADGGLPAEPQQADAQQQASQQ